jgi:hypothetical protein
LAAIQQARGAAFGGRVLRDQVIGQVKVKIAEAVGVRDASFEGHGLEGWTGPFQVGKGWIVAREGRTMLEWFPLLRSK